MNPREPPEAREFDPFHILEVLDRHQVDYIVIGGVAANLHGSNQPTRDLDVTYDTSEANRERLAAALRELGAVRVTDLHDMLPPTADRFLYRVESFTTPVGDVDAFQFVRNIGGYPDLVDQADPVELQPGLQVLIADIDSIIRSKLGSGRDKDPGHIRALERIKEERANERIEQRLGGDRQLQQQEDPLLARDDGDAVRQSPGVDQVERERNHEVGRDIDRSDGYGR